jgi:FtsP/CotA-like multicopper oxidase with cupredoxin domain
MKTSAWTVVLVLFYAAWCQSLHAQPTGGCPRPEAGSTVEEPEDLRSENGVLEAQLTAQDAADVNHSIRYCYRDAAGRESPNLRVNPGDLVILHLKNALTSLSPETEGAPQAHAHMRSQTGSPCSQQIMSAVSTNLHFHGLTIPPRCHQDDVMKTSVQPGDSFEYRFRIPEDEPPGLYWYHPHIHGFSKQQLLGGASGALIVQGIERAKKLTAGLPERVFIIRDLDLINPNAATETPPTTEPASANQRKIYLLITCPFPTPITPPQGSRCGPGKSNCGEYLMHPPSLTLTSL